MTRIDIVARKIKELQALRNPNPPNVAPLFPPADPAITSRYEAAAAFGLSVLGGAVVLLVVAIAVLLG